MSEEKNLKPEAEEKTPLPEQDSIEQILKDFQTQKEKRDLGEDIAPPEHYEREQIDFARTETAEPTEQPPLKKEKRRLPKPKKPDINYKRLAKALVVCVLVAAVAVGGGFGISYAVNQSKVAYLKPYQSKYPDVDFPEGIMEKYCDIYGENPSVRGYINISETSLSSPVIAESDGASPYAEEHPDGYEQFNYVVYMNDNALEEYYATADAYNNRASGFISYSDLFDEYRFKVIGAFYTNTSAEDDDGYIFPYNVTEKMTPDSYADYFDRLKSRFLYDTQTTPTREDKFLTISCPTDFRDGFRFVIVAVLRNDSTDKPTAVEKAKVHYPQVIYDERGEKNPYNLSAHWYPEVIRITSGGTEKTQKQTIEDYVTESDDA